MLSVNVTKHFKNYEAKMDEAEATTVMRPRPVITRPRPDFWPLGRSWDEDLMSLNA